MKKAFVGLMVLASLAGCNQDVVTEVQTEVATPTPTAKFSDTTYGIDFTYPENWIFDKYDAEGVLQAQVSSMPTPDGFACDADYAGVIITSTVRDTTDDFDTWVEKNHVEDVGLGQYGGQITKTEFAGQPAYTVETMGWDTYCPPYGYVIDHSDEEHPDRIVEVIVSRNENYAKGITETDEILKNITFTK